VTLPSSIAAPPRVSVPTGEGTSNVTIRTASEDYDATS